MKILFIYPQVPITFWNFKHILKFISKKATYPPLGLLTVAAMLPREWEKKLVDLNVSPLREKEILWADYVFISAMLVQKDSAKAIIRQCKGLGKKIVAGGPLFTTGHEDFCDVDHFVLGEAEVTLPLFLRDLENGCPKPLYGTEERPDISQTPIPLWDLINMKDYACMPVQYSRGCPFNCEFCDIIIMNGRVPRSKETSQVIGELDALYDRGWRGSVFFVDDNFIGQKEKVKKMLPEIIKWVRERKTPFNFITEASINLADDEVLMRLLGEAGFSRVFIGIETPSDEGLQECSKFQNEGRDLVTLVKKIQNHGLEVLGGFIVGFDSDTTSIFEKQIDLIQKSGVVVAMVGILNALPGTKLYNRLKAENRLIDASSGNNVDFSINFKPTMDISTLIEGYHKILKTIYSPKEYCDRVITFLKEYKPETRHRLQWEEIKAALKSIWYLGIIGKSQRYYWKLISWSLFRRPQSLPVAITLAVYGLHFQRIILE
jgi:radical SAM superfamily enzyme YgiQ (UPF0313 family)